MEKCSKSVEKEEETQQSAQLLEVYANDGRERESQVKKIVCSHLAAKWSQKEREGDLHCTWN